MIQHNFPQHYDIQLDETQHINNKCGNQHNYPQNDVIQLYDTEHANNECETQHNYTHNSKQFNDTQHININVPASITTLSIKITIANAECHYAECRGFNYNDAWYTRMCNYTECRYAECRYTDCPGILSSLKEMILRRFLKDSSHVRRKLSNFSA